MTKKRDKIEAAFFFFFVVVGLVGLGLMWLPLAFLGGAVAGIGVLLLASLGNDSKNIELERYFHG